jgi:hypothetical protein
VLVAIPGAAVNACNEDWRFPEAEIRALGAPEVSEDLAIVELTDGVCPKADLSTCKLPGMDTRAG